LESGKNMSVGIATLGMFNLPTEFIGDITVDNGSTPLAYGGGPMPGSYFKEKKRLKVNVRQVNSFNEKVKIKVQIIND
jgi:hypothetical protein